MTNRRHIVVVSGGRPDYGLLYWLLDEMRADQTLRVTVVATGMHLSARFGRTVDQIRADGFATVEVPVLEEEDSKLAVAHAVGRGVTGMADALASLRPDIVVVLGDRFEILAATQAALLLDIPIAHLHGGEVTEGAVDDAIRHAITKMAHLHFPATEAYAQRIVRMGESPDRVFTVGALGVEAVERLQPFSDDQLAADLGAALTDTTFLVTYHPVTLRKGNEIAAIKALVTALEHFPQARIVITGVNADAGHEVIDHSLRAFASANPGRVSLHAALGQRRYLSVMRRAAVVIGNSSSGLIEAPAVGVPTIDIGDRQAGRLRAETIIHCGETADEITQAIRQAMDPSFHAAMHDTVPPYGGGGVAARIRKVLASIDLRNLTRKRFFDGDAPCP